MLLTIMNSLTTKSDYKNDIRKFQVEGSKTTSVEYLIKEVKKACRFPAAENIVVKYTDEDGDLITFDCDHQLEVALRSLKVDEVFKVIVKNGCEKHDDRIP